MGNILSNNNNNELGVWNNMPDELYIIGDIHGDFFALKQSLELTDCIIFDEYNDKINFNEKKQYFYLDDGCKYYSTDNNNVRWNSKKKNCFIVFSGDLIDRCRPHYILNNECINTINDENCDYLILKLLYDLDNQARKYNSRIIIILGNHEILNLQNDFKYVSKKGRNDNSRTKNIQQYLKTNISNIYGIIRINKYIIVHGGINNIFFKKFNENKNTNNYESIELFNEYLRKSILNDDYILFDDNSSPFWDRSLGGKDYLNENQCKDIFENNLLKIKNFNEIKNELKILVGHCPQFIENKNINLVNCQEYKNKIYRIDIGMSRAFDLYNIDYIIKNITDSYITNILMIDYKNFFKSDNQTNYRVVSCLQYKNNDENIIKGKLSIDYFYDLKIFNDNKIKLLYILSDIKKIFIDNYNHNPYIQNEYLYIINKIQKLIYDLYLLILNDLSK